MTLETYLVFAPGVALYGLSDPGEMVGTDHNVGVALYWRSPRTPTPSNSLL